MGRPTVLRERNNCECPTCGSILTRSRGGGRADTGERLRRRVCQDCGQMFTTVEVALLYADGRPVPLPAVDSEYRLMQRDGQRKRIGYHGLNGAGRKPYEKPARIRVRISVSDPERAA